MLALFMRATYFVRIGKSIFILCFELVLFKELTQLKIMVWDCAICKKTQQKGSNFYQVDLIRDDLVLVSNYHDQAMIKLTSGLKTNDPICVICVKDFAQYQHSFEHEQSYEYQQSGFVCLNLEQSQNYKRNCGTCCRCDNEIVLDSWMKCNGDNLQTNENTAFLIWSNGVASRCFPEPLLKHTYLLSEEIKLEKYPSIMCFDCFKNVDSQPLDGPVRCQLCSNKYQRWIFHWANKPTERGSDCYCFENDGVIYDSDADPYTFQWSTSLRPSGYDSTKPFCSTCLSELIANGYLEPNESSDSSFSIEE
jgi:hypothetical protein